MGTLAYTGGDVITEKGRERRWEKNISKKSIDGIKQKSIYKEKSLEYVCLECF